MINLETLFKVPFDTDKISDDNLNKFTNDHIQRIIANNDNGQYDLMRDATITAYNEYFGSITDEDTVTALRQSLTKTTDNIIDEFKSTISQKEGLIRSIWGKEAPTYQEFFPYGLTEYSNLTKANVETLMKRMSLAATKYQDDLGENFAQLFTDFFNNYKAAREAQLEKKGKVSTDKTTTSAKRDVVEIQLYKNIHKLAIQFPGNPDRGMDFFDQSII